MSPQGMAKKTIYRQVMNEPLHLSRLVKCFTRERALLEEIGLLSKSVATCIDLLYEMCTKIPNVAGEDRFIYEIACSLHKKIVAGQLVQMDSQEFHMLEQTLDICEEFLPPDAIQPRHKSATPVNQYRVQPHTAHRVLPPRHENIPNLLVYNRVELIKLACHSRKGVYFAIRAAHPYANMRRINYQQLSGGNSGKTEANASFRREFWARSDRLSVGSLALGVKKKSPPPTKEEEPDVYPRSKKLRAANVFYRTVAARNDWELSGNSKTLTTYLKFSNRDAQQVFELLRRQQPYQQDEDTFLIEASGVCFPPTKAILQTLQAYDVIQPPELLRQLFANESDAIYTMHLFKTMNHRPNKMK